MIATWLSPKLCFALGSSTSYSYRHDAGTQVRWEHDKAHCPAVSSKCFVVAPNKDGIHGERVAKISRPTGKPFMLVQLFPEHDQPARYRIDDLRSRAALFESADEAEAKARFRALSGAAAELLVAEDGAPARPTLWLTAESLLETVFVDAPLACLLWGIFLWPVYLALMAGYVASIAFATRRRAPMSRRVVLVAAVLTSPLVPFVLASAAAFAVG